MCINIMQRREHFFPYDIWRWFLSKQWKKQENLQPSTVVVANALSHYKWICFQIFLFHIYIIHIFTLFSTTGLHQSSFFHSSHFRELVANGISYRLKFLYLMLFRTWADLINSNIDMLLKMSYSIPFTSKLSRCSYSTN
jgi:hypothetical protein